VIQTGLKNKRRDESEEAIGVGDEAAAAETVDGRLAEDEQVSRYNLDLQLIVCIFTRLSFSHK
jgi:hypothetical protein